MDQESEEGKGKTSPDKQEQSPQVSEHVAWVGRPAHYGGFLCAWDTWAGGFLGGCLEHLEVWICPTDLFSQQVPLKFGLLLG